MTEWYRNTEWSDEIAAEFERRIERSRTQKAQHLSLQGYHLIRNHPDVARDLLTRAVEIGDVHETVRARSFQPVQAPRRPAREAQAGEAPGPAPGARCRP